MRPTRYRILLLLLCLLLCRTAPAQHAGYNYGLAVQIDSMAAEDQKWRQQLAHFRQSGLGDSALDGRLRRGLNETVRRNTAALRSIFDRFGYPGFREIGTTGTEHLWWLIQHADFDPALQKRALALVREQYLQKNVSGQHYAFLQDRVLVNGGEKQWYGTQMQLNADSSSYEPRPVIEPEKLNERRAGVGLMPIEEYVELMNKKHGNLLRRKE